MRHLTVYLALFFLALWEVQAATNCSCGVTSDNQRVWGGQEAPKNKYTWMVWLYMTTGGSSASLCGASIITPRHILTAAHCTRSYTPSQIFAYIGDHNRSTIAETPSTQITSMLAKYEHASYNTSTFTNDISLLVTLSLIQYSNRVGPICLPTSLINTDCSAVKILGWGTTQAQTISDVLKEGQVNVVPTQLCTRFFWSSVTNSQQCIYGPTAGVCPGDSGGPTILWNTAESRYTVVGIHSYKNNAGCDVNYPSVNTYVPAYIDWIQARIQDSRSLATVTGTDVRTCAIV